MDATEYELNRKFNILERTCQLDPISTYGNIQLVETDAGIRDFAALKMSMPLDDKYFAGYTNMTQALASAGIDNNAHKNAAIASAGGNNEDPGLFETSVMPSTDLSARLGAAITFARNNAGGKDILP